MKVHKYDVETGFLELPKGAQILQFDRQHGNPRIWVLVDPEAETEQRHFHLVETGDTVPDNGLQHVGSCDTKGGGKIAHLFEGPPVEADQELQTQESAA